MLLLSYTNIIILSTLSIAFSMINIFTSSYSSSNFRKTCFPIFQTSASVSAIADSPRALYTNISTSPKYDPSTCIRVLTRPTLIMLYVLVPL